MVNVRIIDETYGGVSREATEDEWDRDDTYTDHNIQGFRAVKEKDYYDLSVGFDVKKYKHYYLVYVIYDTGDSFGRDDGQIEFVGLYQDRSVAEENKRRIDKNEKVDSFSVKLVTEDDEEFDCHTPWKGYFECFHGASIEEVLLHD